jgi:hypothetical protein
MESSDNLAGSITNITSPNFPAEGARATRKPTIATSGGSYLCPTSRRLGSSGQLGGGNAAASHTDWHAHRRLSRATANHNSNNHYRYRVDSATTAAAKFELSSTYVLT